MMVQRLIHPRPAAREDAPRRREHPDDAIKRAAGDAERMQAVAMAMQPVQHRLEAAERLAHADEIPPISGK